MIYVLLAPGFEEIEALAPLDIFRRAGLSAATVGIGGREICGTHGIIVKADLLPEEATEPIELLFLPGGMPGAKNLDLSPEVAALIDRAVAEDARLAAICAAPLVLGHRGLLRDKRAVCYPGFEEELEGACILRGERVVTDGLITTAVGMGAACELGLVLSSLLLHSPEKANEIAAGSFLTDWNETRYFGHVCQDLSPDLLGALELGLECGEISTSLLQRKLKVGYGRAAAIMDELREGGYIGTPNENSIYAPLITREQFEQLKAESDGTGEGA